jgi:hypothetical protein
MPQETVSQPTEHQLAAWLEDQRMAFALGELPADKVAQLRVAHGNDVMEQPPGAWAVWFVTSWVREFGQPSGLPEEPTWAQMAAEARTKIIHSIHKEPIHMHGR